MVKKLGLAALFVAVSAVSSFVARAKPPGMRGPGMPRGMLGPGPAAPHRAELADIFMSAEESAHQLIEDGRRTFRFDTFGSTTTDGSRRCSTS